MTSAPSVTAAEVAEWVGGRLVGDGAVTLRGVAPLDRAGPDELTFLADSRFLPQLRASAAGAVLVPPQQATDMPGPATRIVVAKPLHALVAVLRRLHPETPRAPGVHPTAIIGAGTIWGEGVEIAAHVVLGSAVRLGARVRLGPGCVIGDDVAIGDDTCLVARVTIYPRAVLGARVLVHAGTVIGCDGFGFVPDETGHVKIPHVGRVIIDDDVELGANCTVDRGSVADTHIGAGTKVDDQVHVAHNVRIGRGCLIAAQTGIAGSAVIEDGVVLGGQAGIGEHRRIGAGAQLGAQGGATRDLSAGGQYSGTPARPLREWLRANAALYRLAELVDELEELVRHHDHTR